MSTRQVSIALLAVAALVALSAIVYTPLEAGQAQSADSPTVLVMEVAREGSVSNNAPQLAASAAYTWFLPIIIEGPTYAVSGQVTVQSNPLAGVVISTNSGVTTATTLAGTYTLRLLPGVQTLTPSKLGYAFNPVLRTITVTAADVGGQNFAATALPIWSVSGRVTDGANPVVGAVISAGGSYTTTSNSSGYYTLSNLIIGTYTLTATKPGFAFLPRNVTVPPSQTNVNFNRLVVSVTNPRGMVSDVEWNHLFVASGESSAMVSVFTETAGSLSSLSTIALTRSAATGVALLNDKVYVANWGGVDPSSVSVIDAVGLGKIEDIRIDACGGQAANIAVNPITWRVYVTLHAGNQIAVIDTANSNAVTCVIVNTASYGVAVHAASNSIFVGSRDDFSLWRIDGGTNTPTKVVDWRANTGSPYYVSVNPVTNKLFVMVGLPNPDIPNRLYVYNIDPFGGITEAVGSPKTVGNTGDGGHVLQSQSSQCALPNLIYIAANADTDNEVWVLNSDLTLRTRLTSANGIGRRPFALAENTALEQIYVANIQSNTINIISACDATPLR